MTSLAEECDDTAPDSGVAGVCVCVCLNIFTIERDILHRHPATSVHTSPLSEQLKQIQSDLLHLIDLVSVSTEDQRVI